MVFDVGVELIDVVLLGEVCVVVLVIGVFDF